MIALDACLEGVKVPLLRIVRIETRDEEHPIISATAPGQHQGHAVGDTLPELRLTSRFTQLLDTNVGTIPLAAHYLLSRLTGSEGDAIGAGQ